MCTLMIDDQPRLIAWTGHQVNLKADDKKATRSQKRRAQRKKAQAKAFTQSPSTALDEEVICFTSSSREPFRFNGHWALERQGTRYTCTEHNYGRKPVYKDRRFRAKGSSKTRAPHLHA